MSHLAGGVVIVTTRSPRGQLRGMTATAVCSVSVEPPLVMVCLHQGSATHRAVEESGIFGLNFLAADGRHLASRFGSSSEDKFSGVEIEPDSGGAPLLSGALAHCDCEVDQSVPAGDHTIFIGRVLGARSRAEGDRVPLLYFRGAYRSVRDIEAGAVSDESR